MRAFAWIVGVVLTASPALAEREYLQFDRLDAVIVGDQVEVRFVVANQSWQKVAQQGLRPVLIAEVLTNQRKGLLGKAIIVRPGGRFMVALPDDVEARRVRFAVQDPAIAGIKKAGVGVVTVTQKMGEMFSSPAPKPAPVKAVVKILHIKSANAGQHQQPMVHAKSLLEQACARYGKETDACMLAAKDAEPAVVQACEAYGTGSRVRCLKASQGAKVSISNAIRACGLSLAQVEDRLLCVRLVTQSTVDPSPMVQSCSKVMTESVMKVACITRAVSAPVETAVAIEQCSIGMTTNRARLECVSAIGRSIVNLSSAIGACKQALPWQGSRRQCIAIAADAPVDISSAIVACRSGGKSPAAVLSCIRIAGERGDPNIAGAIHGCGRKTQTDPSFNLCVAKLTTTAKSH